MTEPALQDAGGLDPGVPFDPQVAAAPAPEIDPATFRPVSSSAVKRALVKATEYANAYAGDAVRANLVMTSSEADMIAPGIARYINGRPMLMSAVAVGGDEYLTAIVGSIVYGGRIWFERSAALQTAAGAAQAAGPLPPTGGPTPIVQAGQGDPIT